jgi:hypothetical protein
MSPIMVILVKLIMKYSILIVGDNLINLLICLKVNNHNQLLLLLLSGSKHNNNNNNSSRLWRELLALDCI